MYVLFCCDSAFSPPNHDWPFSRTSRWSKVEDLFLFTCMIRLVAMSFINQTSWCRVIYQLNLFLSFCSVILRLTWLHCFLDKRVNFYKFCFWGNTQAILDHFALSRQRKSQMFLTDHKIFSIVKATVLWNKEVSNYENANILYTNKKQNYLKESICWKFYTLLHKPFKMPLFLNSSL